MFKKISILSLLLIASNALAESLDAGGVAGNVTGVTGNIALAITAVTFVIAMIIMIVGLLKLKKGNQGGQDHTGDGWKNIALAGGLVSVISFLGIMNMTLLQDSTEFEDTKTLVQGSGSGSNT